jgi:predicted ATPase
VVVDPLTAAETEELALDLIGRDTPDALLQVAWVARESDGNALFIHELAQHLDAGSRAASSEGIALDDVLWQRVSRLPDDTRRLLEVIAVAGQPIRLRAAQDAAGVPSLPPEAVTALSAGQLVRGTGPATTSSGAPPR